MLGNKNVLGKHWKWNKKSKRKRKKEWEGKTWSPKTQFKKGQTAWNKNKKMLYSTREKISLSLKGKVGEQARNWIDGRSFLPYPSLFNKALKERIKNKYNFQCQGCGIKEKDYFQKLSIHHLDYNKNNCSEENLIPLCRGCNAKVNAKKFREGVTTIWEIPERVKI